jgi:hypothetical protein
MGQTDTAYCENHKQRINTLRGENAVHFNVKTGGVYSYHCPLKVKMQFMYTPYKSKKKFTY